MQPDYSLISRLEKLARLQLNSTEKAGFTEDLSKMLDMVGTLQNLDTSETEPLSYPVPSTVSPREDAIGPQLKNEEALQSAPKQKAPFFQTPKVIDETP